MVLDLVIFVMIIFGGIYEVTAGPWPPPSPPPVQHLKNKQSLWVFHRLFGECVDS